MGKVDGGSGEWEKTPMTPISPSSLDIDLIYYYLLYTLPASLNFNLWQLTNLILGTNRVKSQIKSPI